MERLKRAVSKLRAKIKDKREYLKTIVAPKKDVLELKNQTKQLYTQQSRLNRLLFLHSYFLSKKKEKENAPPT
jgi:hypothetical protein